jgi:3,4-dihydroxy 2-butanone 4-phosphate synthase/GTP cyclohydrolase II
VLVALSEPQSPDEMLARLRQETSHEAKPANTAQWRRNGAGAQILADLGLRRLRVLGAPRRQVGLAGFGLEVVEYVEAPCAG